ncbi:PA2778 family cysteine peptidase [Thiomicrospira microaerophila]|uniref:PA2778 family cysteine peptidase n=1 Tax=Thiomicrospira microaerophila TaxID=406020 RepID=UPI00200D33B5|nr:PA2778 family cysteine peptidase [Thiomicrospira microaerophila]
MSWFLVGCSLLKVEPSSLSLEKTSIELVDVPFYPQAEYQCGPAALATLLQYRGQTILPDDLVSRVYTPQKQGSLQIDMIAAVRQQGLMPYPLAVNMQALLTEVSAGNPVLILQNLSFNWAPVWHYAVVMGYDLERNELILRSGETERWLTTLTTFERTWRRADYWGIVIVEADQIPPTANPLDWLKTAFDLEQTGQADKALIAYRTGFQTWPESVGLGMALGNLLYAQADYLASSKVFQQLSLSHPLEAQVWNNWAYALKAKSCEQAALQAARCANTLAPNHRIYQSTLNEMQTLIHLDQVSCPVVTCRIDKNYED